MLHIVVRIIRHTDQNTFTTKIAKSGIEHEQSTESKSSFIFIIFKNLIKDLIFVFIILFVVDNRNTNTVGTIKCG